MGELIYQNNDPNFLLGIGTVLLKGLRLNSAVFVYTVEVTYMDGREQIQHGNITLVR